MTIGIRREIMWVSSSVLICGCDHSLCCTGGVDLYLHSVRICASRFFSFLKSRSRLESTKSWLVCASHWAFSWFRILFTFNHVLLQYLCDSLQCSSTMRLVTPVTCSTMPCLSGLYLLVILTISPMRIRLWWLLRTSVLNCSFACCLSWMVASSVWSLLLDSSRVNWYYLDASSLLIWSWLSSRTSSSIWYFLVLLFNYLTLSYLDDFLDNFSYSKHHHSFSFQLNCIIFFHMNLYHIWFTSYGQIS